MYIGCMNAFWAIHDNPKSIFEYLLENSYDIAPRTGTNSVIRIAAFGDRFKKCGSVSAAYKRDARTPAAPVPDAYVETEDLKLIFV